MLKGSPEQVEIDNCLKKTVRMFQLLCEIQIRSLLRSEVIDKDICTTVDLREKSQP